MRMLRRMTRGRRRSSGRRRPAPRQEIDRGLLDDVGHLAGAAAVTINRLHRRGLGDIARPLEEALARLGGGRR